jgi:hypothetical protein
MLPAPNCRPGTGAKIKKQAWRIYKAATINCFFLPATDITYHHFFDNLTHNGIVSQYAKPSGLGQWRKLNAVALLSRNAGIYSKTQKCYNKNNQRVAAIA